jgi:hypothetical protein
VSNSAADNFHARRVAVCDGEVLLRVVTSGSKSKPFLKRASASRLSGEWSEDDYDVFADGIVVGRIMKVAAVPEDARRCCMSDLSPPPGRP